MKKHLISLPLFLLVLLCSCKKAPKPFDYSGFDSLEDYMVYLADDFVTKQLDILVDVVSDPAAELNKRGSVFTIQDGQFKNAHIGCFGENEWHIYYDGNFTFGKVSYPTAWNLDIKRSQTDAGTYSYQVIAGVGREEDEIYYVHFNSLPGSDGQGLPQYTQREGESDWLIDGSFYFRVVTPENGEVKYLVRDHLTFHGRDYEITHNK